MDDTTTFFAWSGTVARMVRTPGFGSTIAVWNRHRAEWVEAPGLYGALTGIGGDPAADVISRADAELVISAPPPPRDPLRLDGPGSDVSYRD